jgi:hypothetical protein
MYPITGGGMNNEASPPTSDIKKALTRCEFELPTEEVEFALLGHCEGFGWIEKVSAGIDQLRVEKQFEELVAGVVVKGHRPLVTAQAVKCSGAEIGTFLIPPA